MRLAVVSVSVSPEGGGGLRSPSVAGAVEGRKGLLYADQHGLRSLARLVGYVGLGARRLKTAEAREKQNRKHVGMSPTPVPP